MSVKRLQNVLEQYILVVYSGAASCILLMY